MMLNLVALNLVQDVMQQQFQTEPLHRERHAPSLRWQFSLTAWTHPLAVALRSAADLLEQPTFASQT
jgi:hypothetical protein